MEKAPLNVITREWGMAAALTYDAIWRLSEEGTKPVKQGIRLIARQAALSPGSTAKAINSLEAGAYITIDRGAWQRTQGGAIQPNTITVRDCGKG